jgi:hypothetical protein
MPAARYKFVRDVGIEGFVSSNRPSTDALNAVITWSRGHASRSYAPKTSENEILVVDLTWSDGDGAAAADLDQSCRRFGVDRSLVQP